MANTYNPYSDIKSIYDLKGQWDEANRAGNADKKNQVAATAQAYYDKLRNNGYSGVAQALSASGYQDAKKILDSYSPTKGYAYSAPDSTSLTNPELITTNNNEVRNKINQLWGNQTSDRETIMDKYNKLEDTAYSNPFDTDEAKAILAKYDLSGLQARDNATASGSASNGGNIDSYAASNALRQQAALVNQGQMAVLESHNNRINNVQNTLEKLGVYLQNQDKGMQNTITLQSNEGQRLFENEETAKNNETARLVEQANVTGYTPSEWTIKNDDVYRTYLNEDGTFKKGMENVDIQALINSAKSLGDTETAKKLAVVRAKKILSNYGEFGKYANEGDISYMSPQITEARRESEQNNATVLKTLEEETGLAKHEIDTKKAISDSTLATEKAIADAANQNALDQIEKAAEVGKTKPTLTASQVATAIKNGEVSQDIIDAYNYHFGTNYTVDNPPSLNGSEVLSLDDVDDETNYETSLNTVYDKSSKTVKAYIRNVLEPLIMEHSITESELRENILSYSKEYDLEVKDIKAICGALGVDAKWVDDYKNKGLFGWGSGVKEK